MKPRYSKHQTSGKGPAQPSKTQAGPTSYSVPSNRFTGRIKPYKPRKPTTKPEAFHIRHAGLEKLPKLDIATVPKSERGKVSKRNSFESEMQLFSDLY